MFAPCNHSVCTATAGDYVIHAGRLIDGNSRSHGTDVRDHQGPDRRDREGLCSGRDGQEVIDLKNPPDAGSDDMHTHLDLIRNPAEALLTPSSGTRQIGPAGNRYVEDVLMAGFTTVRNLGNRWLARCGEWATYGAAHLCGGAAIATTGGR